jgi:hypothetical protein
MSLPGETTGVAAGLPEGEEDLSVENRRIKT